MFVVQCVRTSTAEFSQPYFSCFSFCSFLLSFYILKKLLLSSSLCCRCQHVAIEWFGENFLWGQWRKIGKGRWSGRMKMESKIYQKRLLMLLTSAWGPVFGLAADRRRWLLSWYLWLSLELCRSVGLALFPSLSPLFFLSLALSLSPFSPFRQPRFPLFLSLSLSWPLSLPSFLFPSASLYPLPFLLLPLSPFSFWLPFLSPSSSLFPRASTKHHRFLNMIISVWSTN